MPHPDASRPLADDDESDLDAVIRADERASTIFIHANLIFCLLLQRFCVIVGGGVIYWCLPAFFLSLAWLLFTQRATFRGFSTWTYALFAAAALLSTLIALNTSDSRINGLSLPSLLSVLVVYLGLVVVPTSRFHGRRVFDVFILYARALAVFGIVQYLVQFAGIRIFAFSEAVPALRPILAEPFFNYHPVVAYGSPILRSNGFFLLEPSIFSQILMLAVAVDVLVRRRWLFLPLYGIAYVVTYSGTGLFALVVASALAILVAPRTSPRLALMALVGAIVAAIAAAIFPDAFAGLVGRSNELNYEGSSGYARYIGQLKLLGEFGGETRTLVGFGPGALERASIAVTGSINPALKIFFEYGIIGLTCFVVFFVGTLWRRDIAIVSLFMLVNYQLGGGYLLFMPLIVLAALLCIWSDRLLPPSRLLTREF